jgi:hypothetical protein
LGTDNVIRVWDTWRGDCNSIFQIPFDATTEINCLEWDVVYNRRLLIGTKTEGLHCIQFN